MADDARSSSDDIESLIIAFIRNELLDGSPETIDPDDNIFAGGLVDSVGIVRLVGHVTKELEVKVPPADLVPDNFRTVRTMAVYLRQLRGD